MAFPLLVRAVRLSFEAVDRRLEEAAGTLGASRLWVFATVTLPLALPGVLAGMVLAYAKALGEFGATITFVSNIPGETQTLPSAIYTYTQVPGGEAGALRLTLVSIAPRLRRAGRLGAAGPAGGPHGPRPLMLEVDIALPPGRARRSQVALHGRRRRHRPVRPLGRRQDLDRQRDRRPAAARRAAASCSTASRCSTPARGIDVPRHRRRIGYVFQDAAPVPAPHRAPQPALRPLVHAARARRRGSLDEVVELLGIAPLLDAPARHAVRRREAAGRDRPRAAGQPAPAPAGRAAGLARPARKAEILPYLDRLRARGRVPILYRQPRARRGDPARRHAGAGLATAGSPPPARWARSWRGSTSGPLTGRAEAGSILPGHGRRPARGLPADRARRCWASRCWCRASTPPAGTPVRLRVRARDVAVATRVPEEISIRNQLFGRIAGVAPGAGRLRRARDRPRRPPAARAAHPPRRRRAGPRAPASRSWR